MSIPVRDLEALERVTRDLNALYIALAKNDKAALKALAPRFLNLNADAARIRRVARLAVAGERP